MLLYTNMPTKDYPNQVADIFLHTQVETFGDAHATTPEISSLRQLFREKGSREATLSAIKEFGYPVPKEITPEMVALAGAAHSCGVAVSLAKARGVEGKDSTYESYTTKNRFDRFVALHLPEALRDDWSAPIAREPGIVNPKIVYPEGVDTESLHGIVKPSRYLPAQTIRHLEFARLGKLDNATKEAMQIDDAPQECFAIDWDMLIPIIESANSTIRLAGDIGANVAKQLLGNGLDDAQVAAILKKGFSTRGIKEEHGDIPEADEVYNALLDSLASSSITSRVATLIK